MEEYQQEVDDADVFRATADPRAPPPSVRIPERPVAVATAAAATSRAAGESKEHGVDDSPLMLTQWEDKIVWSSPPSTPAADGPSAPTASTGLRLALQDLSDEPVIKRGALATEDWEAVIAWDEQQVPEEALQPPLIMDHNDPFMLWEEQGTYSFTHFILPTSLYYIFVNYVVPL